MILKSVFKKFDKIYEIFLKIRKIIQSIKKSLIAFYKIFTRQIKNVSDNVSSKSVFRKVTYIVFL